MSRSLSRASLSKALPYVNWNAPEAWRVEHWLHDLETMPDPLRLYLDLFIALLPVRRSLGATTNEIKVTCEHQWELYFPKTVWFVALHQNGFRTGNPTPCAVGVKVNTTIFKLGQFNSNARMNRDRMWFSDLYQQWAEARGSSGYAS